MTFGRSGARLGGIAAAVLMLAATSQAQAQQQVTIGALYLDAQGFYGGIKKGIEAGAASDKLRLLGQNSQGDASREASFASTLISSKVDAIIMSPVSATASVPVVRQAAEGAFSAKAAPASGRWETASTFASWGSTPAAKTAGNLVTST